jgi:hypothetical protein
MKDPHYTTDRPIEPGWYWARAQGDETGTMWEAVVYVGEDSGGLYTSWMTGPGTATLAREADWSPLTEWAGPMKPPEADDETDDD